MWSSHSPSLSPPLPSTTRKSPTASSSAPPPKPCSPLPATPNVSAWRRAFSPCSIPGVRPFTFILTCIASFPAAVCPQTITNGLAAAAASFCHVQSNRAQIRPNQWLGPSPSSQQSFPPSLPGGSGRGSCRRQTPVLRRSGTATRPTSFCPLSGPMEKERLGGLRQGSLWRTATGAGVSGPLYPSRGHFQSPPAEVGRWPSLLPVERLPRQADAKGDDRFRRRVHPPLPAACASARLPTHSLLRLPG